MPAGLSEYLSRLPAEIRGNADSEFAKTAIISETQLANAVADSLSESVVKLSSPIQDNLGDLKVALENAFREENGGNKLVGGREGVVENEQGEIRFILAFEQTMTHSFHLALGQGSTIADDKGPVISDTDAVTTQLAWTIPVTMGVENGQFFINTAATDTEMTAVLQSVEVNTNSSVGSGKLGIVPTHFKDRVTNDGTGSRFIGGTFYVDARDSNGDGRVEPFQEELTVATDLDGQAEVQLHANGSFLSDFILDSLPVELQETVTQLVDLKFATDVSLTVDFDEPFAGDQGYDTEPTIQVGDVVFENFSIDTHTLISPLISSLQERLRPLSEFVDLLTKPIKELKDAINELGQSSVKVPTLLSIAKALIDLRNDKNELRKYESVESVLTFVEGILQYRPRQSGGMQNLGGFIANSEKSSDQPLRNQGLDRNLLDQAKSDMQQAVKDNAEPDSSFELKKQIRSGVAIEFPFLNQPDSLPKLLLGHGSGVDLFTTNLTFGLGLTGTYNHPIAPFLSLRVNGEVGVDFNVGAGYDATGIVDVLSGLDLAASTDERDKYIYLNRNKFADGFYLDDHVTNLVDGFHGGDGNFDDPGDKEEFRLNAGIDIGLVLGADAVVADGELSLTAGIDFDIKGDLNDLPNSDGKYDGKIRLGELKQIDKYNREHGYGVLDGAVFNLQGSADFDLTLKGRATLGIPGAQIVFETTVGPLTVPIFKVELNHHSDSDVLDAVGLPKPGFRRDGTEVEIDLGQLIGEHAPDLQPGETAHFEILGLGTNENGYHRFRLNGSHGIPVDEMEDVNRLILNGEGTPFPITVEFYNYDGAVEFRGSDFDNHVQYRGTGNAVITGGMGNDILIGGSGNDELNGKGGSDRLVGGAGNDELTGGTDDRYLVAYDLNKRNEDDTFHEVQLPLHHDVLIGGDGQDTLIGSNGNDFLWGNDGEDKLYGRLGQDFLDGGADEDEIFGDCDEASNNTCDEAVDGDTVVMKTSEMEDIVRMGKATYPHWNGVKETVVVIDDAEASNISVSADPISFESDREWIQIGNSIIDATDNILIRSRGGGDRISISPLGDLVSEVHIDFWGGDDILKNSVDLHLGNEKDDVKVRGAFGREFATIPTAEFGVSPRTHTVAHFYGTENSLGAEVFIANGWTNDVLRVKGGGGDDVIDVSSTAMNPGTIELYGEADNDKLSVAYGHLGVFMDGGRGNDQLNGGDGNDVLLGQADHDRLVGNGGHDLLDGGRGNDRLIGGDGADQFKFLPDFSSGRDVIEADSQQRGDYLDFRGTQTDVTAWLFKNSTWQKINSNLDIFLLGHVRGIYGGEGNDNLSGDGDNNYLYGGGGDDTLQGQGGIDNLIGGPGNDKLYGGPDDDSLSGKSDNDELVGGPGNDSLRGGEGEDVLEGGGDNDWMHGGDDNDEYRFDADSSLGTDTIFESAAGGIDTLNFTPTLSQILVPSGYQQELVVNENLTVIGEHLSRVENVLANTSFEVDGLLVEGKTHRVAIKRWGYVGEPADYAIEVVDGTAIEGQDYELIQSSITFAENESTTFLDLELIDDAVAETLETMHLRVVEFNELLPIVILDDDTSDVSSKGDKIARINGENNGTGVGGGTTPNTGVANAIDNTFAKYQNSFELNSGFQVTPNVGPTVVDGLRVFAANDQPNRDPASYRLEGRGENTDGFELISKGEIDLPLGRNSLDSEVDGERSFVEIRFENLTEYETYRLRFPTLRDSSAAESMQVGEVELLGVATQPPSAFYGDSDNNDVVDFGDFLVLSANFGRQVDPFADGDTNGDELVDFADFLTLSRNFGKSVSDLRG